MGFQTGKMEDIPKTVTDYTDHGKCSGCGACCTHRLVMSEREFKRIINYVKTKRIQPYRNIIPTVLPHIDITCPFRDNTANICRIYAVRPMICRIFKCDLSSAEIRAKMIKAYGGSLDDLIPYNFREYKWND